MILRYDVLKNEKLTTFKIILKIIQILESINSTLYIDPVKWRQLNDTIKISFFAGRSNAPLFKLLK